MTPEELINLSLQYEAEIEAFTTIPAKRLLTFDFKGCSPLKTCRIPLYLALHLQSLNLCSIIPPQYISKEYVENIIQKEKTETNFVELPEYFFEHSTLFMNDEIESAICELRSIRNSKIRKGLSNLDGKALYITGLSKWEFNQFKDIIRKPMVFGKKIEEVEEE
ncbi:uncharacterized protein VICG_00691 [Vittaforma corneae ATCC 50505]|uniref:GINS subunit domain-containing protein n=1 Tax=Vittaforma corneae (strain ATCC 50505) TaxID=993615 RepID=L2GN83_VITCO|nr:uncharacterized protein VICG_00691 [Vittaforma corneae ATCC 50505]ELA42291.1 hypothetical protein VICG_00691 [Vittaforma corneae ATCC 50505]